MTDKLRHGPLWTTIFAIISLIWIYPIALVFINSFKKRVYISKDVFSLPTGDTGLGLYCAVIVKRVDAKTRAKTAINELLRA